MLNLGNTRNIWVRVTAPTAPVSDPPPPPNITTITATYAGGPLVTTDTTTLTEGVSLRKYQQLISCTATPSVTFSSTVTPNIPDAPWTTAAVGAITNPASAPGQCIAYLVVATNVAGSALTSVQISDTVPVGGPATVQTSCGAALATAPGSAPIGAVGAGAVGAISTTAPTLAIGAKFHLRFCVQINQA
jgi:trimeric autotransporter adhesin